MGATPKPAPQGVAVLATNGARDAAFVLARAIYGSSLRPRTLDELRARILAGDPAPAASSREVRELAELRGSIAGEDAASRRLLASIAQQLGVQALLVVSPTSVRPQTEKEKPSETSEGDGGLPAADAGLPSADLGAQEPTPPAPTSTVMARLFLTDSGEFDAARYEPDTSGGWRGTVASLAGRFPRATAAPTPQVQGAPPRMSTEEKGSKPFYTSPWLWGAIGAAVVIGGFFFLASQDTSDDPIHLQMKVPR